MASERKNKQPNVYQTSDLVDLLLRTIDTQSRYIDALVRAAGVKLPPPDNNNDDDDESERDA